MSNLLLNNINNISLSSICLSERDNYYKIIYNDKTISLEGLSFKCPGYVRKINPDYLYIIKDNSIIRLN